MHEPNITNWKGAMRVLAYIKGTPGKCLLYKKYGHLEVEIYSNSGYVGDKEVKKSILGYYTYVRGNLITWGSKGRMWSPNLVHK